MILGDLYVSYTAALEVCGLQNLDERTRKRCLDLALKCAKHQKMESFFPLSQETKEHNLGQTKEIKVNIASTAAFQNPAVPYCQRLLNEYYKGEKQILNLLYLLL